jgi:two-component system nitrogen regulation sensor histidine kinase GlnL
MELRPVDIAAVADRALDSARTQFPDSPVTVEKRYDANLPPVDADEQLCEQAILNLVVNAYQAIDGRPGTLEFSIAASSNHAGQPGVEITVADTGPGVPEELREQIFNPFVTSKKDGVGLGLAIVAKIVDDHHGTIRLDPSAERGASFRVFLPAAAKD